MTPEELERQRMLGQQQPLVEIPSDVVGGLTTLVEPVFGPPDPGAIASREALMQAPPGLGGVTDPAMARAMGGSYNALAPEVINQMWKP